MADNDWDALIIQPGSTGPNRQDDWDSLIAPHSATSELTGGQLPRNETPEARARRLAADQRWQSARPHERVGAGVGHLISGIPGVRHIPGVRDIRSNQLVRDYMLARGDEAAFSEIAGNTAPYLGVGALAPRLLSRFLPAALTGATIEGGDRALGANSRDDILNEAILGAIQGVAGAVPGSLLGSAITPRHPLRASQNRIQRERQRIWPAATPDNPNPRMRPMPLDRAPPRQLPPDAADRLRSALGWGIVGAAGGSMFDQALLGAGAGVLGSRFARPLSEATVRGANRVLSTRPIQATERALHRYSNNMVLSPQSQALLNALGLGGTAGLTDIAPFDPSSTLTGR